MWNNQGGGGAGGGGYDQGQGGYGDQGGGYLNSPNNMGTPGGSQERKSRQRSQNIMPVTFAQIYNCEQQDDKFVIDGVELHQVTAVGLVRSVKETQTRLDYDVDDMSGPPLEVRQFVDNGDDNADEERTMPMRENTYVRMFGHVRSFQNKRSLVAFKMQPLTDMNELTNHLLEVIHAHIHCTKGTKAAASSSTAGAVATPGGTQQQPMNDYAGAQPDQGLTTAQQQVYNVIRSCNDDQGVSISYIGERVKGVPVKALRDAIEFLSGEGHIYSTIDDDHFKSTDGM